jgi:hypothetical protein
MGFGARWRPSVAGGAMTTYLVTFHVVGRFDLPSGDVLAYQVEADDAPSAVAKAMRALDDLGIRSDRLAYFSYSEARVTNA